jgi:uncharacterized protein YpbB
VIENCFNIKAATLLSSRRSQGRVRQIYDYVALHHKIEVNSIYCLRAYEKYKKIRSEFAEKREYFQCGEWRHISSNFSPR